MAAKRKAPKKRQHGSIEQRGNRYRWRCQGQSGTAHTRQEAEAAIARVVAGQVRPESLTVADLVQRHIDDGRESLSPWTIARYQVLLDSHIRPGIGNWRVVDLKPRDVERFIDGMKRVQSRTNPNVDLRKPLATATKQQTRALLRVALRNAERDDILSRNVAAIAQPPKREEKKKITPPSSGGARELLAAARANSPTFGLVVELAMVTGARRGELVGLRWEDLGPDGVLTVAHSIVEFGQVWQRRQTKTGVTKHLPIPPETLSRMRDQYARLAAIVPGVAPEWVVADDPTSPWSVHRVSSTWRKIRAAHGYTNVRFHDLRHFVASELKKAGMESTAVGAYLGHADGSMVDRVYAHSDDDRMRAASATMGALIAPDGHGDQ